MSRYDGKASVEHQLDIHVNDLLQQDPHQPHLPSLLDILHGLRYVMDYRIRGGRMPNLDPALCHRLGKALVLLSGHRQHRSLLERVRGIEGGRMAEEAGLAFGLLLDFLQEQPACLTALRTMPVDEVRRRLCLGVRLVHEETRREALLLLRLVSPVLEPAELLSPAQLEANLEAIQATQPPATAMVSKKLEVWPPQGLFFDRDPERLLDMFRVQMGRGLRQAEVEERAAWYGPNQLGVGVRGRGLGRLLLNQLADFMMGVLLVACLGSAVIDWPNPTSALVLLLVILLNVAIGVAQEWKSERTLAHLRALQLPMARVWREGEVVTVPAGELVPGDLVVMAEGDAIPADLRLLQASHLQVVEAALTGESEAIGKQPAAIRGIKSRRLALTACTGNVWAGTQVAKGTGVGLVVRIGAATELGKIQQALGDSTLAPQTSPLTRRLQRLGMLLVALSFLLCLLVLVAGLAWKQPAWTMLRIAVSLAVSVIPEGLVAVVTVTMALGVGRLARQQAVVRQLPAVEALGAITVICTDKTGTLTEGRMRVEQAWALADEDDERIPNADSHEADSHEADSQAADSQAAMADSKMLETRPSLLAWCAALCSDAYWDGQAQAWRGDTTEQALMQWACTEGGVDREALPAKTERLVELPFDSDRKLMTIGYAPREQWLGRESCAVLAWVKGAPERILERCTRWWNGREMVAISGDFLERVSLLEGEWSDQGLRVLFLAMRPLSSLEEEASVERDLVLLGEVGLLDPPRPGVKEAIQQAQQAGIQVCMITGDHLRTATCIAMRLGIITPQNQRAIRGDELDLLSEEALRELHPFPVVMARVSPAHKLAIVKALQARGEQVLMTGDGVNDAPAIKRANVGVAMVN